MLSKVWSFKQSKTTSSFFCIQFITNEQVKLVSYTWEGSISRILILAVPLRRYYPVTSCLNLHKFTLSILLSVPPQLLKGEGSWIMHTRNGPWWAIPSHSQQKSPPPACFTIRLTCPRVTQHTCWWVWGYPQSGRTLEGIAISLDLRVYNVAVLHHRRLWNIPQGTPPDNRLARAGLSQGTPPDNRLARAGLSQGTPPDNRLARAGLSPWALRPQGVSAALCNTDLNWGHYIQG